MQVLCKQVFSGHKSSVYSVIQHPHKTNAWISTGGDGMVVEWNAEGTQDGFLLATVPAQIFSICISAHDPLLFLGQMNGDIHVLDLERKSEVKRIQHHHTGVFDFWINHDSTRLYSAGGDGQLCLWKLPDMLLLRSIRVSHASLRKIEKHPFLPWLAIGASDHSWYLVDIEYQKVIHRQPHHQGSVFGLAFHPSGTLLATGSRDAQLAIWSMDDTPSLTHTIAAHLFTINDLSWSPNGKILASASRDKSIRLWDGDHFQLLKVLDREKYGVHQNSVNRILYRKDHPGWVACSDDRTLSLWTLENEAL